MLPVTCVVNNEFVWRYGAQLLWPLALLIGFVLVFLLGCFPRRAAELAFRRVVESLADILSSGGRLRGVFDNFQAASLESPSGITLGARLGWWRPVQWVNAKNAIGKT